MLLSEARALRAEIVALRRHAPAHKGARGMSRNIMRTINNMREDVALMLGGSQHLAKDHEIDERLAERMRAALARAYEEDAQEHLAETVARRRSPITRQKLEQLYGNGRA